MNTVLSCMKLFASIKLMHPRTEMKGENRQGVKSYKKYNFVLKQFFSYVFYKDLESSCFVQLPPCKARGSLNISEQCPESCDNAVTSAQCVTHLCLSQPRWESLVDTTFRGAIKVYFLYLCYRFLADVQLCQSSGGLR